MSPRAYRLGRRAQAAEQRRSRILKAAWGLLAPGAKVQEFSLDAVARRAGVARMTVYYQFRSKRGLLEALFDWLAARGRIGGLIGAAFQRADGLEALDQLVVAFGQFFGASPMAHRRVRALAALDPELGDALHARDQRRREAMQAMAARLTRQGHLPGGPSEDVVDALTLLTSFEAFDQLAGEVKDFRDVTPLLQRLCRAVVTTARP